MIDAYTIGITLALDNGVAEGVAAIRRELDLLDRSIGTVAGNLAQLRKASAGLAQDAPGTGLAAGLSRLTQPTPSRPAPPGTEAGAATGSPARQPPQATVLPAPSSYAVPQRSIETSQVSAAPAQSPVVAAPQADTRAGSPKAPTAAPPASAVHPAAAPVQAAAPRRMPAAPLEPDNPMRAPTAAAIPAAPTSQVAPPAMSMAPTPPATKAREAPVYVTPAQPMARPFRADQQTNATQYAPVREADHATPRSSLAPPANTPDNSVAPNRQTGAVEQAAPVSPQSASRFIPAAPAAPPPAAPQAASGSNGGDVFLDGSRLGHWVQNRMARDASRPPNGATGFDPRLSFAWPGAPIGS